MKLFPKQIRAFQKAILDYYKKHGREFPWRPPSSTVGGLRRGKGDLDPYAVFVSEVMLQQTQVDRVVPKYREWMKKFPNPESLAKAPLKKVLQAWSGLGYNRRALYLKRAAEIIVREHGGEVPRDVEKLDALPGIGPYTAAAILAFAWSQPTVFIETNIRTVYLHFFFTGRRKIRDEEILEMVRGTLPFGRHSNILKNVGMSERAPTVRAWYSALMDYGAMLKRTEGNPNAQSAHYMRQKPFAGSRRELRGKIMQFFARSEHASVGKLKRAVRPVNQNLSAILNQLVREGFLRKEGGKYLLQK